jgi:hypothetical protein
MDLPRILRLLYGAGQTDKDWHAPSWNTPMANEFIEVEKQIVAAIARLQALEATIDAQAKQQVASEFDARYEPANALVATTRFASPEWQSAWRDLVVAVQKAEELKKSHEASGNTSNRSSI